VQRAVAVIVWMLAACATRPPAPAVPPWTALTGTAVSIDADERALWDKAEDQHAKLAQKNLLVTDPALAAYLQSVLAALQVEPIPAEAPRPAVYVIRSSDRTAISFANGEILITTGALAVIQNEAQLAGMLGHELGHVLARHALIDARFAKTSRSTVERMQLAREHEAYADAYAVQAMSGAGYDPHEMPRMLQLIASNETEAPQMEPFRSHPFTRERIQTLTEHMADAHGQALRTDAERYDHAIVDVLSVAAQAELDAGLLDHANASIARLLALRPESGRGYYLKGEYARLTEREGRRSPTVRDAYKRAVELAPDDPEAVRALGFLYRDDGDLAAATPLLDRYLKLAPDAADRGLIERYLGRNHP